MEYELKKKIHITCPHCERAIETEIDLELEKQRQEKQRQEKQRQEKQRQEELKIQK
ncbi:MAG: hypothetical protein ACRBB2_03900 [Nitrosopumilus sp.]